MQGLKNNKKRKVNVIEYSQSKRRANLFTKKGKQNQTAALNINLKTINKNELIKMKILSKIFSYTGEDQKNIIADYLVEKANFTTTRKLFGAQNTTYSASTHQRIQKYMQKYYRSSQFPKNILQNENMDFANKIILLKFVQKIRQSAVDPYKHNNWKQKF